MVQDHIRTPKLNELTMAVRCLIAESVSNALDWLNDTSVEDVEQMTIGNVRTQSMNFLQTALDPSESNIEISTELQEALYEYINAHLEFTIVIRG